MTKEYRGKDVCVLTIRGELARRIKDIAEEQLLDTRAVALALIRRGLSYRMPADETEAPATKPVAQPVALADEGPGF